jgi:CBS domain-containing protein
MRASDLEGPLANVMHEGVVTCTTDTPLSTVAELMAGHNVHCVVVSDDAESAASLWGVVSDLDLVAAVGVRDLEEQSAGGSAATPALTVTLDETLRRAAQLMTEHGVTHLVVVDRSQTHPIGVLSTLDIARAVSSSPSL